METVQFDFDGFITPDQGVEISHEQMEGLFRKDFPGEDRRQLLWENYRRWLHEFRMKISQEAEIWIDGSYVTKREIPDDMDILVLIDYLVWQEKEDVFRELKREYGNTQPPLDIYHLLVYPENHPNDHLMNINKSEWLHLFTRTRPNRRRKVFKKGFMIINYERDR